MKQVLMLILLSIAHVAQSAQLATYRGSFSNYSYAGSIDFQIGQGTWMSVPPACAKYVQSYGSKGFSAYSKNLELGRTPHCQNAIMTIDLENSSLCQSNQTAKRYSPPNLISVQCF